MHPIWFSRGGFLPPPAKSISEHVYKHFLELMRAASCSVTFRFHFAMDVMVFKHFDGDLSFLGHGIPYPDMLPTFGSMYGYGMPYPDMQFHIA